MTLAVETDTALADLYNAAQTQRDRIARSAHSLASMAGADFYYRGRQRVTDMKPAEAERIVRAELAKHADDEYGYGHLSTSRSSSVGSARYVIEHLDAARDELARIEAEMEPLETIYRAHGWSRFFLVTSSQGHVHSSMSCSTCRPTTAYGWLPQLSGSTEEAAVEAHGPALCSVCFSSAPVEWVGGKLTKAQAAKAAH